MSPWFVSRQSQWPDGTLVVEINADGLDNANPGMLVEKYDGEGQEYTDPREAVEKAIAIAKAWSADLRAGPRKDRQAVGIAHGSTGGMTMPFEGEPLNEKTFKGLRAWADGAWEKLDKCCQCGTVIRGRYVYLYNDQDFKFCDGQCAENYEIAGAEELAEEEEELDEELDEEEVEVE